MLDPGKKLFDAIRKHVRLGDLALTEWDTRSYKEGSWTSTIYGLPEADKEKWRKAAKELGLDAL